MLLLAPGEVSILKVLTKTLKYDEKPDYRYLRGLFKNAAIEKELVYDNFDWAIQKVLLSFLC